MIEILERTPCEYYTIFTDGSNDQSTSKDINVFYKTLLNISLKKKMALYYFLI